LCAAAAGNSDALTLLGGLLPARRERVVKNLMANKEAASRQVGGIACGMDGSGCCIVSGLVPLPCVLTPSLSLLWCALLLLLGTDA
jgi:hypothetical protein